jgi:hypothetical protein
MEAAWASVMLVSYHITAQRHNPYDHDMNFDTVKTTNLAKQQLCQTENAETVSGFAI